MTGASPLIAVPAGARLFHAGDACTGFAIVHEGTLRVGLTAANGREIVLYRVGPGDVCLQTFARLAGGGGAYSAEGVAETAMRIEMLSPAAFAVRVAGDAGFRDLLFGAVARRFADFERVVERVALTGIAPRLAAALLALADQDGRVAATHAVLASEIGSAREVVSRQLATFARRGLVGGGRGALRVLAPARLEALAAAVT